MVWVVDEAIQTDSFNNQLVSYQEHSDFGWPPSPQNINLQQDNRLVIVLLSDPQQVIFALGVTLSNDLILLHPYTSPTSTAAPRKIGTGATDIAPGNHTH